MRKIFLVFIILISCVSLTVIGYDYFDGTGLTTDYIKEYTPVNSTEKYKGLYKNHYDNALNSAVIIKSNYLNDGSNGYETINLNDLIFENYKINGLQIHASNADIYLKDIQIIQSDSVTQYSGSKGLIVATDVSQRAYGNNLYMDDFSIKYAKANFMFWQNVKYWEVKNIVSDSAMYNPDGTDAHYNIATFIKMDNVYADSIDLRHGTIDKIEFKNSNQSTDLTKVDGTPASSFVRAIWFDEGFNNCTVDSIICDLPVALFTSNNQYTYGDHYFKYIYLKNKRFATSSLIANSTIEKGVFDSTVVNLTNVHLDTLKYINTANITLKNGSTYDVLINDGTGQLITTDN